MNFLALETVIPAAIHRLPFPLPEQHARKSIRMNGPTHQANDVPDLDPLGSYRLGELRLNSTATTGGIKTLCLFKQVNCTCLTQMKQGTCVTNDNQAHFS
jgi:hypothetical protein